MFYKNGFVVVNFNSLFYVFSANSSMILVHQNMHYNATYYNIDISINDKYLFLINANIMDIFYLSNFSVYWASAFD
jgi:hypothetical protein